MGKVVNQRELAEIFGVSQVALWQWQKDGMPVLVETENGHANQYDTESVIAWRMARELSKIQSETSKDRLARLQGDRVQMEIDEMQGRLIAIDKIEPAWTAMVLSARSHLRAEPDRLAHLLETTEGVDAKRDLIAESFDEFLRKLATYDPGDDEETVAKPGSEGGAEICATAEDDRGGVG